MLYTHPILPAFVVSVGDAISIQRIWPTTFTGFRTVLRRIEIWVAAAAQARLADERKELLQKRQKLVDDMYHQYATSRFAAEMWSSLPPAEVVRELKYFKRFISSESEEVGDLLAERSAEQLDAFIDTSFEKPKKVLTMVSLLANGKKKAEGDDCWFEVLELATAVFSCPPCDADAETASEAAALVGWSELKNHLYCALPKDKASTTMAHERKGKPEFPLRANKNGTKDALSLLKLLELDPSTTTAEELDKLDPRFLCMCCPREASKSQIGRKAMKWRESVGY